MKTIYVLIVPWLLIGGAKASPEIEGIETGAKKYYRDGYIELRCQEADPSKCELEIGLLDATRKYAIDLAMYGYDRAGAPIGGYLAGKTKNSSIPFYISVSCSDDDLSLLDRKDQDAECKLLGTAAGDDLVVNEIEVTPVCGDGRSRYRKIRGEHKH